MMILSCLLLFAVSCGAVLGAPAPAYSSSVYVRQGPGILPYQYGHYSPSEYGLPPAVAQLSSGVKSVHPHTSHLAGIPPCVSPCMLEPAAVAQPVAPAQVLTYPAAAAPQIVTYDTAVPQVLGYVPQAVEVPDTSSSYQYSYRIYDDSTGDQKTQHEIKDGSQVRGHYSLLQPDGYIREVQYTADDLNGFNAVVKNFLPSYPLVKGDIKEIEIDPCAPQHNHKASEVEHMLEHTHEEHKLPHVHHKEQHAEKYKEHESHSKEQEDKGLETKLEEIEEIAEHIYELEKHVKHHEEPQKLHQQEHHIAEPEKNSVEHLGEHKKESEDQENREKEEKKEEQEDREKEEKKEEQKDREKEEEIIEELKEELEHEVQELREETEQENHSIEPEAKHAHEHMEAIEVESENKEASAEKDELKEREKLEEHETEHAEKEPEHLGHAHAEHEHAEHEHTQTEHEHAHAEHKNPEHHHNSEESEIEHVHHLNHVVEPSGEKEALTNNKIVLTYDDIIRCAQATVESRAEEMSEPKTKLTYILLPSLGDHKPC